MFSVAGCLYFFSPAESFRAEKCHSLPDLSISKIYNGYTCAVQKAIGDSDRSGTVDILDVIQINKYLLGSGNIKDTEVADVDEDGQITSSDALNVLKIALDMLTSEEVNHLHLKK